MLGVLSAILPVFMLLALGWSLRRLHFPGDAFWAHLDPLVYYVLFPALLVHTFAGVDITRLDILPTALATVSTMIVASGLVFLLRRSFGVDGPGFSSVLQGVVRFNTYVGYGVAAALYEMTGITLFSVVVAFVIPTANLISIAGLARYGGDGMADTRAVLGAIVKNPLILSVLLGVVLSTTGIGLPFVIEPFLDILRHGALPLGLLAAGAGLDLAAVRNAGRPVLMVSVVRLLLMPLLALVACELFGVGELARVAILIYAMMPVSPAAYILARQLGGDATLMAAIVTATTFASIATVPLWIVLVR